MPTFYYCQFSEPSENGVISKIHNKENLSDFEDFSGQ